MKLSEMFDKKYLGRVALIVVGVVAAVGVAVYAGAHFVKRFSAGLDLVDAKLTTVTDTVSADAYIMRSEKPIFSEAASGSVVPEAHDGMHIQSGAVIAEIYSQSSPEVEERLDEIDEQIALYEKNKQEESSVQSTFGIEKDIYDTLTEMRLKAETGNYADEISMRTTFLIKIKRRAILTGEIKDYDAQISKLQSEREELTKELGKNLGTVYAGEAGYYYSKYDGYSDIFSPNKIDTMTFDDFGEMISSEPKSTSGVVGVNVSDFNWYIACLVKKTDAGVIDSLGRCSVFFTYSGIKLTMTVVRVIPETGGDRAIVILRSGKMPTGFDFTRMQPVEISTKSYTGFEIPKSAVRVVDGHEGVYVMDEVTIAFKKINIVYDDGANVICTGEDTGGITIVNEKDDLSPTVMEDEDDTESEDEYGWIKQNDIIVVSGTELYSGKVIG